MISFVQAFSRLYGLLFAHKCLHEHANLYSPHQTAFCPTCGEAVRLVWIIVRCRGCGSKRHPKKGLEGQIQPRFEFCQHCGSPHFKVIRKAKLQGHEVPYALVMTELVIQDEPDGAEYQPAGYHPYSARYPKGPLTSVFEGHVVKPTLKLQ